MTNRAGASTGPGNATSGSTNQNCLTVRQSRGPTAPYSYPKFVFPDNKNTSSAHETERGQCHPKHALIPYHIRNTPTRSTTYEPSMVDYRLHAAASGEIYRRGEHQRQQEEDSGEAPNRFVVLVEAVSVAEVDESSPSPFPEPAEED
jgi:hypothetical protein